MKLYLVHCGFYDDTIGEGLYEGHTNFFIAATTFEEARARAKTLPEYKARRMHVDGLVEIEVVDGYRVKLEGVHAQEGKTVLHNQKHRDLAAPTTP